MNLANRIYKKGRGLPRRTACVLAALLMAGSYIFMMPRTVEAAIGVRGSTSNAVTGTTTFSLSVPAGTVEGDILVAVIVATGNVTFTRQPDVWTQIVSTNNGTNVTTVSFYHKVIANDFTAFQWTASATSNMAGGMTAYAGVDYDNPIDASGGSNTGTSSSVLANEIMTTSPNAWVIGAFGIASNSAFNSPSGMIQRYDRTTSCGLLCTDVTVEAADKAQATAGATGQQTANTSDNDIAAWAAHLIALRPAVWTYSQSGYRWFSNVDSADFVSTASDPTGGDDKINATALDTTNGFIYTAGYEGAGADTRWRIEKRNVSDGTLVSGFGGTGCTANRAGAVCFNPTGGDDRINAIAIDASGGFLYAAGYDSTGSNRWRVEKRSLSTGAFASGTTAGGFANGELVNDPNSGASDQIYAIALDTANDAMFLGGKDGASNGQWRTEKRKLSDGTLITSFNSTGIIVSDFSSNSGKDEHITSIALDIAGGVAYFGGFDSSPTGSQDMAWRVEKRSMSTGALGSGFGNNNGLGCAASSSSGTAVYCVNPNGGGTSIDKVTALALDSTYMFIAGVDTNNGGQWRADRITLSNNTITASLVSQNIANSSEESITGIFSDGTNIYLAGYDNAGSNGAGGASYRWRIEKRTVGGAVVSGFGTSGVVTNDPTTGSDQAHAMVIDTGGGALYAAGFDATGANQWRLEKRTTAAGAAGYVPVARAGLNTAYRAFANEAVRLRWLMHIGGANLYPGSGETFKLQIAPKSGTCDTAYVGEEGSFQDLAPSSGQVRHLDNPGATDGAATSAISGDPTHSSPAHTNVVQSYRESNNFSVSATTLNGQDGLWDFVINEDGATAFGAFCIRVLPINAATNVPTEVAEIVYCDTPRTPDVQMRGGNYFCDGSKAGRFFWTR